MHDLIATYAQLDTAARRARGGLRQAVADHIPQLAHAIANGAAPHTVDDLLGTLELLLTRQIDRLDAVLDVDHS